jgi:hypothetical protein
LTKTRGRGETNAAIAIRHTIERPHRETAAGNGGEEGIRTLDTALDRITV